MRLTVERMQENRRHARVRELVKRSVGGIIRKMFPVQEVGVVSVTDVRMSSDLRSAVIFLSIFGKNVQREKALTTIRDQTKQIQMLLAADVILKYVPQIRFSLDESIDRGNRVLEILKELGLDDEEPGGGLSRKE